MRLPQSISQPIIMTSPHAALVVARSLADFAVAIRDAKNQATSITTLDSITSLDDLTELLQNRLSKLDDAVKRLESVVDSASSDPAKSKLIDQRLVWLKRIAVMLQSWGVKRAWEDDDAIRKASKRRVDGLMRVAGFAVRLAARRVHRIHGGGIGPGLEEIGPGWGLGTGSNSDRFDFGSLDVELEEIERRGPCVEEPMDDAEEYQEILGKMKALFLGHAFS